MIYKKDLLDRIERLEGIVNNRTSDNENILNLILCKMGKKLKVTKVVKTDFFYRDIIVKNFELVDNKKVK